jgi:hypothetical protein
MVVLPQSSSFRTMGFVNDRAFRIIPSIEHWLKATRTSVRRRLRFSLLRSELDDLDDATLEVAAQVKVALRVATILGRWLPRFAWL